MGGCAKASAFFMRGFSRTEGEMDSITKHFAAQNVKSHPEGWLS